LEELLSRDDYYKEKVQASRARRAEFQKFFDNLKNPGSDPDTERRMQEVLKGGRSYEKRLHAIDENLYGTAEGIKFSEELRHKAIKERKQKEEQRKEQRRRKHKQKQELVAEGKVNSDNDSNGEGKTKKKKKKQKKVTESPAAEEASEIVPSRKIMQSSYVADRGKILTVAAVTGTIAVAAMGIFFGGRPRSS